MLEREDDISVVGEAGDVASVAAEVARCTPDVAVLDVRLADGSGIEACRAIRSEFESVQCLMLTSFHDEQAIVDAAMAGAAEYVLKQIRGKDPSPTPIGRATGCSSYPARRRACASRRAAGTRSSTGRSERLSGG